MKASTIHPEQLLENTVKLGGGGSKYKVISGTAKQSDSFGHALHRQKRLVRA